MVVALLNLLPSRGIQGAAISSIIGYSTMFLVALFWLIRRRQITLWECLRLRWEDIPRSFMRHLCEVGLRRVLRDQQPGKPVKHWLRELNRQFGCERTMTCVRGRDANLRGVSFYGYLEAADR